MTKTQNFWNEMAGMRNDVWYTYKRAQALSDVWNNDAELQAAATAAGAELLDGCPVTGNELTSLVTVAQQIVALMGGQATSAAEYYRTLAGLLFEPTVTE